MKAKWMCRQCRCVRVHLDGALVCAGCEAYNDRLLTCERYHKHHARQKDSAFCDSCNADIGLNLWDDTLEF